MIGKHDRGRSDPCAKYFDGLTGPVRKEACEYVVGANVPVTN